MYSFILNNNSESRNMNEIIKNVSDIETIKNYVNINLNNSKLLLKDIENISDIETYEKENGYSYNSDIIEKGNLFDISFRNIDYYSKNNLLLGNYTDNYNYPLINIQIPKKKFFIDFLDNIEILISKIVEVLTERITYKKHLILLNEIELFLKSSFSENIFYGYNYNNEYYSERFPKFFKINIENLENTPKNIYKILKHSYLKILNVIYKIISENVL